jgi:DNA adenine methylase
VVFDIAQYVRMAELMQTMKGRMMVSVNDIPEMREVFSGFEIESVGIKYSRGLGVAGQEY